MTLPEPRPVENQNPAIKEFLRPLAAAIADDTKTTGRDPRQHPDCPKIAGTLSCLEAGGRMCDECLWWADVAGGDDE